jgi:hypothetical protein
METKANRQPVRNPLAVEMLDEEFAEGSGVKIGYTNGELSFERSE